MRWTPRGSGEQSNRPWARAKPRPAAARAGTFPTPAALSAALLRPQPAPGALPTPGTIDASAAAEVAFEAFFDNASKGTPKIVDEGL
jgi:hypothetical protein